MGEESWNLRVKSTQEQQLEKKDTQGQRERKDPKKGDQNTDPKREKRKEKRYPNRKRAEKTKGWGIRSNMSHTRVGNHEAIPSKKVETP